MGKLISGFRQYRVGIPMSYVVLFNLGKMRSDYIQLRGGLVSSHVIRYSLGEIKSGVVCSGIVEVRLHAIQCCAMLCTYVVYRFDKVLRGSVIP